MLSFLVCEREKVFLLLSYKRPSGKLTHRPRESRESSDRPPAHTDLDECRTHDHISLALRCLALPPANEGHGTGIPDSDLPRHSQTLCVSDLWV